MHPHFEAHAAHADRLANVFLAVNDEFLGQHMQHLLIGRDVDGFGGFQNPRHIGLGDFLVLDRDHSTGVEAQNVAARDAGVNAADLAIAHQFGFLQRALNRRHRAFDVHDHAALESARFMLAQSDHLVSIVTAHLGDNGNHFRGADVQTHDQVLGFPRHGCFLPALVWPLTPAAAGDVGALLVMAASRAVASVIRSSMLKASAS